MCYVLRGDELVLNLMVEDFCSFKRIPTLDKEKLAGEICQVNGFEEVFEIEVDSELTENLLFFVIDNPCYKGKYFTDYPLNKVVGFASRSSLQRAIDSFNQNQSDYFIDCCSDDAKFVRCSTGIVYQVPVDNYFLAQTVINNAKRIESLNSFVREGYERV